MKRILTIFAILTTLTLSGCGRFSPLSPELKQELQNQNGKIDDIKNNQNGLMLDLLNLRQQNDINARDIQNLQNGLINYNKNNQNSGVQILQGDGALVAVFATIVIGMLLVLYYRSQALKQTKTAEIMAQQIANYNDVDLNDNVFMAAMNSNVEDQVYHLMVKSQNQYKCYRQREQAADE